MDPAAATQFSIASLHLCWVSKSCCQPIKFPAGGKRGASREKKGKDRGVSSYSSSRSFSSSASISFLLLCQQLFKYQPVRQTDTSYFLKYQLIVSTDKTKNERSCQTVRTRLFKLSISLQDKKTFQWIHMPENILYCN